MRDQISDVLMNHVVETKLPNRNVSQIPLVDLLCKNTNLISVGIDEVNCITDKLVNAIKGVKDE